MNALAEASRLLRFETARLKAGFGNAMRGHSKGEQYRAIRMLLVSSTLAAGIGWIWVQALASNQPSGAGLRSGVPVANILCLIILVDGLRRGATGSRWEQMFAQRWLPAAGVAPVPVAVRAAACVGLRTALVSWVPLLPIVDALTALPLTQKLSLLTVGLSFGWMGDAAGQVWRFGRTATRVFVALGILAWWLLLVLAFLAGSDVVLGFERLGIVATGLWRALLAPVSGLAVALGLLASAISVDIVAGRWAFDRLRWLSDRPGLTRALRVRGTGRVRPVGKWGSLLRREGQRLIDWVVEEPIAVVVLAAFSAALPFAAWVRPERAERFFGRQGLDWAVVFTLGLPALAFTEIIWGRETRSMWAWYRLTLSQPLLAAWSHVIATAVSLVAWLVVLALLVSPVIGSTRSLATYIELGAVVIIAVAGIGGAAGMTAMRWGGAQTLFGRLIRYLSVATALVAPLSIHAASHSVLWTGLGAGALTGIGILICGEQVRRMQFERAET